MNAFEERKLAVGIYVDFTKAFYYLDDSLLLKMLEYYGFRGTPLMLLKSFLGSRMQFVQINEHTSAVEPILSGVPQGTILGRFLFSIFVNDIPQIDNQAKFVICADDTTLLFSASSANELELKANKSLVEVEKWADFNRLKINTNKTKAIVFHSKNTLLNRVMNFDLCGANIEIVTLFKTLSVIFSESMKCNEHVEYVASRLFRITGLTFVTKQILPTRVKLLIYNSLFASHLNYCCLIW